MSRLNDLLRQLRVDNPRLADDLQREYDALVDRRSFGLNFERHVPEAVELPGRKVRRGDKVHVRGHDDARVPGGHRQWKVVEIVQREGERRASLASSDDAEEVSVPVADLVVVAEFRDPIYPGLVSSGRVDLGGYKPYHVVIEAENFHALQTLLFTHQGKVDCIYIDPPYNTGGKFAWLYNDEFVEAGDLYQHSKWLSFMERRLLIARDILKATGVIIVSIGDHEQHRLRMLMDQVFGSENQVAQLAVEMSTTSGPKTTNAQQGTIVKNLEYVLIYRKSALFDSAIRHTPLYDGVDRWDANYPLWLNDDGTTENLYSRMDADPTVRADIERFKLVKDEGKESGKFVGAAGMDVLLAASEPARSFVLNNLDRIARTDTAPVSAKGVEVGIGRWVEYETDDRSYRITRSKSGKVWQIYTLDRNYRMSDDYFRRFGRTVIRGDLWRGFHSDMGHVSREGGIGFSNGKKPIRLIKQLLRWANNDPHAVVLDFFGGSGTTTHAVAAMNAEDGGSRQCILVTNNELSLEATAAAQKRGLRPGDEEWEADGVFQSRTRPRICNVAKELEINVEFFTLTYEAPLRVAANREFSRISPLLWLRAGARGRRIEDLAKGWEVADTYGVIADLDKAGEFINAVRDGQAVRQAFIVTDEDRLFESMVEALPEHVQSVRLYETYLRNFEVEAGRGAR